jgi:23S rRNA (cytosine1962-C5)-methyltransferase
MEIIRIKNDKKITKKINNGFQWLFSNELVELPDIPAGSLVKVVDYSNNNYGLGFFNKNSLIAVRLLNSDVFNSELIINRIANAATLRKRLFPDETSYRLVFGESDNLSGLIIDKYNDYFSIQILTAGFERNLELLINSISSIFPSTKGIILNNNSYWRTIEGLTNEDKIIFGEIPEFIQITENNIKYEISLILGQKTGFFFDQRINRKFLQNMSANQSVLDLFCNQGGFALNAVKGGASKTLGIDSSSFSIDLALKNSKINNFQNTNFEVQDVFDFLKIQTQKWDIVICDPPAFAKNKKSVKNAMIGYKRVNKLAMKVLKKDGILLTSSCSQHIREDIFYGIILQSAKELNRNLKLIYTGLQSPDHPILTSMDETRYLKFFGFVVE